ncbi:MAG: DUF1007 family protein [Bauldia sp.]
MTDRLLRFALAWAPLAFAAALCLAPPAAEAHPHVFVDGKAEILFDAQGRVSGVRNIWIFDKQFSDIAIEGLDKNRDGKLDADELKPLAKINVESLKEYDYFTFVTFEKKLETFGEATDYHLEYRDKRLTLFFTLPLKEPRAQASSVAVQVFDPEYFVAFTFPKEAPVRLVGAPRGCRGTYQAPHELDAQTLTALAAIPAGQRDLPRALAAAAVGLAHSFAIAC